MSVPSNLHKGRVTLSGVVVFENGRVLNKEKSARDHVFDGHVYLPTNNSNEALAAFRYFNPGDPLLTPHAYFINAQISGMPSELPPTYVATHSITSDALKLGDYHLVGDIKQLIPFGPVDPSLDDAVDPRFPAYISACGVVDSVVVSADRIVFKIIVEQYSTPLAQLATIGVTSTIDIGSHRWAFLKDANKRKGFIKQGGYVLVEGPLHSLETIANGSSVHRISLGLRVEDVTLLGKAPVPSVEAPVELDDTSLGGKRKRPESETPLRFSYSQFSSKRPRKESVPLAPLSTQSSSTSSVLGNLSQKP